MGSSNALDIGAFSRRQFEKYGTSLDGRTSLTSIVLPDEEAEAKLLIDRQFVQMTGKPFDYRTTGYWISVKLFVRPDELKQVIDADGKTQTIWLSPEVQKEDKYQTTVGLVIGLGPQAYRGKDRHGNERFPEGPWCRVGDWVEFHRGECAPKAFRGVAVGILADDRVMGIVPDPMDIAPINQATKV